MRVIGGTAKGRRLASVPGNTTRPILDRVRTALFDILRPTLPGARVLDLFAGSGTVGIEALSQGAAFCVFIDIEKAAVRTIKENLALTGLSEKAEVRHTDAFGYLRRTPDSFDLIYIAPPQFKTLWLSALQCIAERPELVNPQGRIMVQIDPKEYEATLMTHFEEVDQRRYGNTLLVTYCRVTSGVCSS